MKKNTIYIKRCQDCIFYEHLDGTKWQCKLYRRASFSPPIKKADFCKAEKIEVYEKED